MKQQIVEGHIFEATGWTLMGTPVGHACIKCDRQVGPMLYFVKIERCPFATEADKEAHNG